MIPQEYFDIVKKHFNGDSEKTWNWFKCQHPNLGFGVLTPLNAIKLGKEKSVIDFINKHMR
jgi:hypothetical protein